MEIRRRSVVNSLNENQSLNIASQYLVEIRAEGHTLITTDHNGNQENYNITGVKKLVCYDNLLTELPMFPEGLEVLICDNNQLVSLSNLPNSLKKLSCSGNRLTSLPPLPGGLDFLSCSGNNLTFLATLPETINYLDCRNNPLRYVNFIKNRPKTYGVPTLLSPNYFRYYYYKQNYILQSKTRYLFIFLLTKRINYHILRILDGVLFENLARGVPYHLDMQVQNRGIRLASHEMFFDQ